MELVGLFAVVCTNDIEECTAWYTKLLGHGPDDRPMEGLAQWRYGDAGLQIVRDERNAGKSLLTLVVPDLMKARSRIEAEGFSMDDTFEGDFGRIAQMNDRDGNRLTFAESPK